MKRFVLASLLFFSLVHADEENIGVGLVDSTPVKEEVDIGLSEAVRTSQKLFKLLFNQSDKQAEEIKQLKKEVNDLKQMIYKTNEPKRTVSSVFSEISYKKFVSSESVFMRSGPSKKASIEKVGSFGDIVDCKSIKNNWCVTKDNLFIGNKSLAFYNHYNLLIIQDVFAKKGLNPTKGTQLINRGTSINAIGEVNEKYVLENGLLIDKKYAVK